MPKGMAAVAGLVLAVSMVLPVAAQTPPPDDVTGQVAARPRQGGARSGAGRDAVFRSGLDIRGHRQSLSYRPGAGRPACAEFGARRADTASPHVERGNGSCAREAARGHGNGRSQRQPHLHGAGGLGIVQDHRHGDEPADAAHTDRSLAAHLRRLQAGGARLRGRDRLAGRDAKRRRSRRNPGSHCGGWCATPTCACSCPRSRAACARRWRATTRRASSLPHGCRSARPPCCAISSNGSPAAWRGDGELVIPGRGRAEWPLEVL